MIVVKTLNMIVAFTLELVMFFSLGYYGFQSSKQLIWKYSLAIGLPLAAILLWAVFAAPKSQTRLAPPYRNIFELLIFLTAAALLYRLGLKNWAFLLAILAVFSEVTGYILEQ